MTKAQSTAQPTARSTPGHPSRVSPSRVSPSRAICILACLCLALGLAACDDSSESTGNATDPQTGPPANSEAQSSPSADAESQTNSTAGPEAQTTPPPKAWNEVDPLSQLTAPASVKVGPIEGEGDERTAERVITNTSDRKITSVVVQMHFMDENGNVSSTVPFTQTGFRSLPDRPEYALGPGESESGSVSSMFMEADTATVEGVVRSVDFEDGGTWPAMPAPPSARTGDTPVSARMVGLVGTGDQAMPAVACFNHDARPVEMVRYEIEYLDADGNVLGTTSYGELSNSAIMASESGTMIVGGGAPPPETADVRVNVTDVRFVEESE